MQYTETKQLHAPRALNAYSEVLLGVFCMAIDANRRTSN